MLSTSKDYGTPPNPSTILTVVGRIVVLLPSASPGAALVRRVAVRCVGEYLKIILNRKLNIAIH